MPDPLQTILKKLNEIDSRLKKIEDNPLSVGTRPQTAEVKKKERDPLFSKALEIAQKNDETPSSLLRKLLNVDQQRAEKLIDQLVETGLGTSYWDEI